MGLEDGNTIPDASEFDDRDYNGEFTFTEYQALAMATAIYPGRGTTVGLTYIGLGLGEGGEIQGKIKKVMRDDAGELTDDARAKIVDEAGDLLWYLAGLAEELGVPLSRIAQKNVAKLADRASRGKLKGDGDKR